jgi:YfiH family protein
MLVPGVPAPFPLRWGFSTKDDPPEALPRRHLSQIHGCRVWEAEDGQVQQGDGLWTQRRGRPIGIRVADCVPILLAGFAQGRPWIAALHAGWRGAAAGILRRGVEVFKGLGGEPASLAWALGPCIGPCHFEVGPEVPEALRQDPAWSESCAHAGPRGRPHLDLHAYLRGQALHVGMDPARDGSVPLCTQCREDLFFSYRRGDLEGRQWGLAEIL